MFAGVINTPLNTIKKIFPGVSKLKLMTFSMINFSYQYLPEATAYLEPSRTFNNGDFLRNILFLQNSQENTCAGVSF